MQKPCCFPGPCRFSWRRRRKSTKKPKAKDKRRKLRPDQDALSKYIYIYIYSVTNSCWTYNKCHLTLLRRGCKTHDHWMRERQRGRKRAPVSLLCLLPGNNILRCATNGSHAWRKLHLREKKKNSIFHGGFWRWPFSLGSIASVRISAQTGVDNEISLESPTAYHCLNISVGRGISNDWFYLLVNTQRHKNVHGFLLCWGVNTLLQFILTLCHIGSHMQLHCSL